MLPEYPAGYGKNENTRSRLPELMQGEEKIFASVAPSIAGQFGEKATLDRLRAALKNLGFTDMIEVALFADILTVSEAFAFDELVAGEEDFFLTSCCCPIWVKLVERNYPEIFAHMSRSVSPMILSGRILKTLDPGSRVVFISPCTAKKVEARDEEFTGDIDDVITFSELEEIFADFNIEPEHLSPDKKDQASFTGRIYARTGGVSLSVKSVVNRIAPGRLINLRAKRLHGIEECRRFLQKLAEGEFVRENFIEGMACEGGCIGGPDTIIAAEEAMGRVNRSGEDSLIMTPMDNLNILEILQDFGLEDFSDIADNEEFLPLLKREGGEVKV